jgi:hypothetical protein
MKKHVYSLPVQVNMCYIIHYITCPVSVSLPYLHVRKHSGDMPGWYYMDAEEGSIWEIRYKCILSSPNLALKAKRRRGDLV